MTKRNKKKKTSGKRLNKECYNNWWIMGIYIFIPLILVLIMNTFFRTKLIESMYGFETQGAIFMNSDYVLNNMVSPFSKSLLVLTSITLSYVILRNVQRVLIKKKLYFKYAEICLKGFEVGSVFIAIILAIYSTELEPFDPSEYGYAVENLKTVIDGDEQVLYISLEAIPRLHSVGLDSLEAGIWYKILLKSSTGVYYIVDKIEVFIAVLGAILIPLKNYVDAMEKAK